MLSFASSSGAESPYTLEAFLGGAKSFSTNLVIQQRGQPDIHLEASYETRAFQFPLYYSFRLGIHRGGGTWEVQFTHHKIFLTNNPAEVQNFEITHGYNIATINRSWSRLPLTIRVGGGVVVAHPQSTVRGKSYSDGYQLTGPVILAGVGKSIDLSSRVFLSAEAQFAYGRASVSIADGSARAPNLALHGLFGFGFRF